MYRGKIFERRKKIPLEGIAVSDGKNIVFTDSNGDFELPGWERAKVIFVCALTNRQNDWFIVIEGHKGDFNFFIESEFSDKTDFCFLHTSDSEIENRSSVDFIPFMKENVIKNNAAFFIHTGDLCRDDGVKRHYLAMNRETLGCPVRYSIGNHDFIGPDYGEETYERFYGPTWYSFDYGNIHFVNLSIGWGDNPSAYKKEDQYIWLKNDLDALAKGKKIVIFSHEMCKGDERGFSPELNGEKIALREKGLIAWVFGHYHSNFVNEVNGIFNICTSLPDRGGIDSSIAGIRRIDISNGVLSSEMIYNTPEILEASDESLWSTQISGHVEYCTPIIHNGDIIIGTTDDGYPKDCGIYRINGNSGDIIWKYQTVNSVSGQIAFDNGRVYAQDSEGYLYCLDALNGNLIYKVYSDFEVYDHTRCGVIIAENLIIAGRSSRLFAYDKMSGELVWKRFYEILGDTPASMVYDAERSQIIISIQWRYIAAVDLASGFIKWKNRYDNVRYRTQTPLVHDGKIYTNGLNSFYVLDALTGRVIMWTKLHADADVCGAPAIFDTEIYTPTSARGVLQLDKNTLEITNSFPVGVAKLFASPYKTGNIQTVESSPIIRDDALIFSANDGAVYFYDRNSAGLEKKICIGSPMLVSPYVDEDFMITADFSGKIKKTSLKI